MEEVQRIVAIPNPVIRNLEITHCYSRLAASFAEANGAGANWCTYATWASRQAGSTIRGEDLLEQLGRKLVAGRWLLHPAAKLWRRLLRKGLFQRETRLGRLTNALHTPFDAFERASDAVARGNLKVFEEIGVEFARYLHECPPGTDDSDAVQRFLAALDDREPPEGKRYLRRAFTHYERRRHESDPRGQAQLAVLANLEVGFHEQTRLQPEIREALDAPHATKEDLGRRALEAVFPSATRWWAIVRRPAVAVAGVVAAGAQRASSRLAREVITESLMVMSLPDRVLALGTHLGDPYPVELRKPSDAELIELIGRFETVAADPDDCGARDWSVLDQRMHYIVHLFCAFHLREELSRPPFTREQVARFSRGDVPGGEL